MRVGILTGEEYGSNYFAGTLLKRYLAKVGIECFHTRAFDPVEFARVDVAVMIRPVAADMLPQVHALKRAGVPLVFAADDQLFAVPAWSPSHAQVMRWDMQRILRGLLACADVIVTPSRTLARVFGKEFPRAKFHYVPNAFDRDVKLLKPFPRLEGASKPTVGWSGGGQHGQDLAALDPVWDRCLEKGYELSFVGDVPQSVNGRPGTHFISGCTGVELYQQSMPLAGMHVGLAPLLDCEFNRCKSALKAVEYMHLCGCPMVLQDLDPYDEVEADGRRILKVKGHDPEEWMAAIEVALQTYREEGRRYHLPPQYDMANAIHGWVAAIKDAFRIARGFPVDEQMVAAPGVTGPLRAVEQEPAPVGAPA